MSAQQIGDMSRLGKFTTPERRRSAKEAARKRKAAAVPHPPRQVTDHLGDLVMLPNAAAMLDRRIAVGVQHENLIAATLADNECEHGRLPGDVNTAVCGCWGSSDQGTRPDTDPDDDPTTTPAASLPAAA